MFVHDAILEALTCGDTQIDTNIFKKKIKEINECNPQTHLTEFENQFRVCTARSEEKTLFYCYPSYKVLEKVSPKPDEISRTKALQYPTKNHSDLYLPGVWAS